MGLKFVFFATPAASLHHCIPINWWMRLTTKRSRRLKRCNSAKGRSGASTALMQSTVQPTIQAEALSWKVFCTSFYISARFCKIFLALYSPPSPLDWWCTYWRLSLPTAKVLQGRCFCVRKFWKSHGYSWLLCFCILVFVDSRRDLLQFGKHCLHL